MRADIHDGRELELQGETGYIDARPYCQIDETSCTARPDHTFGSIASIRTRSPDVWLSPNSGARADISGPQLRATSGLMHRSKRLFERLPLVSFSKIAHERPYPLTSFHALV